MVVVDGGGKDWGLRKKGKLNKDGSQSITSPSVLSS